MSHGSDTHAAAAAAQVHTDAPVKAAVVGHTLVEAVAEQHRRKP